MTATFFTDDNLTVTSTHIFYHGENGIRRFVARHKYGGNATFVTFLKKNFTVEEYFYIYDKYSWPPLRILESKGFLSPNIRKALKANGYPVNNAGFTAMKDMSFAKHEKHPAKDWAVSGLRD